MDNNAAGFDAVLVYALYAPLFAVSVSALALGGTYGVPRGRKWETYVGAGMGAAIGAFCSVMPGVALVFGLLAIWRTWRS